MTTLIEPRAESEPEAAPLAAAGAGTSRSVARGIFRGVFRTPGIASALCGERWWLRAALALVFTLYVRAIGFAPVYDDNVISPWSGEWSDVPKFFTHDIFGS